MKASHRDFEKWALIRLRKLQKILLLEHFEPLTIEYKNDNHITAECQFTYPYQSITVRYSNLLFKDFEARRFGKVLAVLAHEMAHPLTDGLYSKATERFPSKNEVEDERERLTDHIANVILKNHLV